MHLLSDSQTVFYTPDEPHRRVKVDSRGFGTVTGYTHGPSMSFRWFIGGRLLYRELSVLGYPVGEDHEPVLIDQ
jgi:hypothetical protein